MNAYVEPTWSRYLSFSFILSIYSCRMRMDYSPVREHPALLQLQKWGPSEAQLNLSEFREAFISPTRQLLLLLSYQCDALLLPILTGDTPTSHFYICFSVIFNVTVCASCK